MYEQKSLYCTIFAIFDKQRTENSFVSFLFPTKRERYFVMLWFYGEEWDALSRGCHSGLIK